MESQFHIIPIIAIWSKMLQQRFGSRSEFCELVPQSSASESKEWPGIKTTNFLPFLTFVVITRSW